MTARAAVVQAEPALEYLARFRQKVPVARNVLGLFALALLGIGMLTVPGPGFTQAAKPSAAATKATVATPAKRAATGSSWEELTPMQQQALKPLAVSWNTSISEAQKRKWLQISKNFPSLPPQEQATLHSRMHEWVSLSPQQRAQARLNFGKTRELSKELTAEEKKAKWQAYQALSVEEKKKLATKASPKPAGAATAIKPVAPQKLVTVPPRVRQPSTKITPAQPALENPPVAPQR